MVRRRRRRRNSLVPLLGFAAARCSTCLRSYRSATHKTLL